MSWKTNFRRKVWATGVCVYCAHSVPESRRNSCGPYRTVDHIVPAALGGPLRQWNLLPACSRCNNRRALSWPPSALVVSQFREQVRLKEEIALGKCRDRYPELLGDYPATLPGRMIPPAFTEEEILDKETRRALKREKVLALVPDEVKSALKSLSQSQL